jgi:hypothetical protein
VPEQQQVPDEAVKAAWRAYNRMDGTMEHAVEAAASLIRAQVISELRDAASDQGPRSAYWLAADYLERK